MPMALVPQNSKPLFIIILLCAIGFFICFLYIQVNTHRPIKPMFLTSEKVIHGVDNSQDILHHETDLDKSSSLLNISNNNINAIPVDGSMTLQSENLCPENPIGLVGSLSVTFETPTFEEIAKANPRLKPGGIFKPTECVARSRVAIIVPYRDRELQLRAFLHHMHPILQRQMLEYGIFVINQAGSNKFNRAILMNIGYNESIQIGDWECFVFHDVDLFLEDDRAPYACPEGPRHMSGYIDKFSYKLPYNGIFGGISSVPRKIFEMVNGYSNLYFGWGGEDDDMYKRLTHKKFEISRYNRNIMKYKMWKHSHEKSNSANDRRFWLLKNTIDRMNIDGLNSLVYNRLSLEKLPTHTLATVEFSEKDLTKKIFGAG